MTALILVFGVSSGFAGSVLKGRIVDGGMTDQGNGIPGVTVEVFQGSPRSRLGETITDSDGRYELTVNAPRQARLILSISKIGYFARPTEQEAVAAVEQKVTRLLREAAAADYYLRVSSNVVRAKPEGVQAFYASVLSLPARQKTLVLDSIKGTDQAVYAEFSTADKAVQAAQDITTRLGPNAPIRVYPNFGSPGTVRLSGSVSTHGQKLDFAKAIGKYSGITRVQNDLGIEPAMKPFSTKIFSIDQGMSGLEKMPGESGK